MDPKLFTTISRFPFIHNGTFYNSIELSQNPSCLSCETRDCIYNLKEKPNQYEYICSKGFNNTMLVINDYKYIINGLIFKINNIVPIAGKLKFLKNKSKQAVLSSITGKLEGRDQNNQRWIVDKDSMKLFFRKIKEIEAYINSTVNETIEKNFSMFHDFKTSMNIFFSCTHDIINKLPGTTFEEKLRLSDKSFHDLYNSLQLITSQLGMVDVIINPKSIEFGTKKVINLFRLFEKIKVLFGHLVNKKEEVKINITADGKINDSLCFESIEFIPLILIDNAVKYSVKDSVIEIKLEQRNNFITVKVRSIGPFVSDENKDRIFEKFFRDESATKFSKNGIGMGLWIAQKILEAHQSKLKYERDPYEKRQIGLNIFEFDLPIYRY